MNTLTLRSSLVAVMLLFSLAVAACQPIVATNMLASGTMPPASALKPWVGAWSVETTVEKQNAIFPALLTFTGDGIVIADEPPSPFETTGHGNWVATGSDTANFTFLALIGSAEGPLSATIKVAGSLVYDAASDGWSGPFKIWVHDANGEELLADNGTFTGTRIAVEAAATEGAPAPVSLVLEPVAVFDAFNAAVNAHDVDKQLSFFAEDAVAHFPTNSPPAVYTALAEIRTWLELDAKDNIHVEIENAKVSGDTVSATAKVTVDGLPPDLILAGTVEVTVKEGKITSFSYTLDDETLAKLAALESK